MGTMRLDGRRIRELREVAGYRYQQDLAEAAGVRAQTISALECGNEKVCSPETLDRILAALGATRDDVLTDAPTAETLTEQERELVTLFRSLPDESWRAQALFRLAEMAGHFGKAGITSGETEAAEIDSLHDSDGSQPQPHRRHTGGGIQ